MTQYKSRKSKQACGTFVDLFAGCGGISLGLMSAGWTGLFAVERDSSAFETLNHNLIHGQRNCPVKYQWPTWLEKSPAEISEFLKKYRKDLVEIAGTVDLLAGGPPCQGFSLAGRRLQDDPRNSLFKHYVEMVKTLQPSILLLENVKGISVAFKNKEVNGNKKQSTKPRPAFSEKIKESLENVGYRVFSKLVYGTDVGVPQFRPRFIFIGIKRQLVEGFEEFDPFSKFDVSRKKFLKKKRLPIDRPITVEQAISDLTKKAKKIIDCEDSRGFKQIKYSSPISDYQRLMHGDLNGTAPNSLRLARHRVEIIKRFKKILKTCRKGVALSDGDRKRLGIKKHSVIPLDPDKPSHTLTTLPDDILHYSEPRILTVREYARLQSFPDWYEFKGNYTTGGHRRVLECPRYTQVGNAVPPLLAEFLGFMIAELASEIRLDRKRQKSSKNARR